MLCSRLYYHSSLLHYIIIYYLSQTFLTGPHRGMDDLEEQLPCTGIEDEDGAVDGFGCQVTLKCLEGSNGGSSILGQQISYQYGRSYLVCALSSTTRNPLGVELHIHNQFERDPVNHYWYRS